MSENRTGKYFKYAIGEIILVVIGILIALQINNWNENRKARILEMEILKDIKKSLNADIVNQLNPNIEIIVQDLKNINDIEVTIKNKLAYNDSLNPKYRSLMFSKAFKYEITAYKNLENEGIQIIKDSDIKNDIVRLYNMNYPELQAYIDNFSNNLMAFFRPEMRGKFKFEYTNSDEAIYVPIDYDELINDIVFMNNVLTAKINFQNIYRALNNTKLDVENVIDKIDSKLQD